MSARKLLAVIERFSSGTAWEPVVGYSRAVRAGPFVFVAGCTSTDAGGSFVDGDAQAQARRALENVQAALQLAGTSLDRVVQTRMYVTDISDWEAIGAAHAEVFATVRPVAAMVEVAALIDARMCIEVEAVAYDPPPNQ